MRSLSEKDLEFVCWLTFDNLQGDSPTRRYCSLCKCHVHNLSTYCEDAVRALLREAVEKQERVCVTGLPPSTDVPRCDPSDMPMALGILRKPSDVLRDNQ